MGNNGKVNIKGKIMTAYTIVKTKGVVTIKNPSLGFDHSCHPNIDKTGSVKGMKMKGYWDKDAQTVKIGNWIYNLSTIVREDYLDDICAFLEEYPIEFEGKKVNRFTDSEPKFIFTFPVEKETIKNGFASLIEKFQKEGKVKDANEFISNYVGGGYVI